MQITPQWIDVQDNLPNPLFEYAVSRWVLTYVSSPTASDYYLVDCYNHDLQHWQEFAAWEADHGSLDETVTHWCELPQSPLLEDQPP